MVTPVIDEFANRQINQTELAERKIVLVSLPQRVDIEASLSCNLRCCWCHEHSPYFVGMPKRPSVWPEELTERVDECIKTSTVFSFQGFCEPFLDMPLVHKWLDRISRLTVNKTCRKVGIVTNGIFPLSPDRTAIIDHPSLGTINFSMDAATPGTFAFIKKAPMSRAVANLKQFLKARGSARKGEPWIGVSFIVTQYNIRELLDFIRQFCLEGVDYINIYDCIVMDKRHLMVAEKTAPATPAEFSLAHAYISPADTRFPDLIKAAEKIAENFETTINWSKTFTAKTMCTAPWDQINIQTDGSVRVCCRGHTVIGNLFHNTFEEIWNGEAVRNLRRALLRGGGVNPTLCKTSHCAYLL
jgi:MoaA/NifB/PqqE/SkfB family radical SAM enzyme